MAASGVSGPRDAKECAVSPEQQHKNKDKPVERGSDGAALLDQEQPLDVWSRCAPIRLAGYEDDLTETHILRSID
jgi:hypothetical protein